MESDDIDAIKESLLIAESRVESLKKELENCYFVERVLIAANIVSQDKFDEARALLAK